jgi:hypothetical protein
MIFFKYNWGGGGHLEKWNTFLHAFQFLKRSLKSYIKQGALQLHYKKWNRSLRIAKCNWNIVSPLIIRLDPPTPTCVSIMFKVIFSPSPIYLWGRLFVYLFCLSCWDLSNHLFPPFCFDGENLMSRVAPSWFHNFLTCGGKVIEYWTIFSLKTHSNIKYKI